MFNKILCNKCRRKVKDNYEFCPYCGASLRGLTSDFGMLGKNDFTPLQDEIKLPLGFNTIFTSLMKNLDKQFKELEKSGNKDLSPKKEGISISISSSGNEAPRIKVKSFGGNNNQPKKKQIKESPSINFSQKKLKNFSKLPRNEPTTDVRRFSDRVVYEIDLPDINSMEDVSIAKLEKSIEIKAVSKNKSYFKSIPVNLPVINYLLSEGKLILEFEAKN